MKRRYSVAVATMLITSMQAYAGGFEAPNHSAAAAGVSNAFVATANDPSALIYNPAGIAWQPGISLQGVLYENFRDSSVKIPGGIAPNKGAEPVAGAFFATWSPLSSRWSGGFGFAPLYQLNNDWSVAFPGSAEVAKITVDHATFDGVYAINSDLAVGAGADWYVTRATLQQGASSFHGRDFGGFGGHLSLMWKPMPAWTVGAIYRSGASVSVTQGASSLAFKLPDHATLAVAHDFADVWRFETDLKWSRWSALKDLNVRSGGVVTQANPVHLRDTLSVMAGLTWTWREDSQFRFGYAYEQGANRSQGFSPIVADQDGHRISLGAGGKLGGAHVDIAYQYVYYSKKSAKGRFAGTYRDRKQSIILSFSKIL